MSQGVIDRSSVRDLTVVGLALGLTAALAWGWLTLSSGHMTVAAAPPAIDMSRMDFGTVAGQAMSGSAYFAEAFFLWSLMMIAMMLPTAALMIMAFVHHAVVVSRLAVMSSTAVFVVSYLAVWIGFSALAATAQTALVQTELLPSASLAVGDARLVGLVLILVGFHQMSGFKRICLDACRSPALFLRRYWRPGLLGAVRPGLVHGTYCLGACWLLMALLFIVGVMSVPWALALAAFLLVERLAPGGRRISLVSGIAALFAGLFLVFGPSLAS